MQAKVWKLKDGPLAQLIFAQGLLPCSNKATRSCKDLAFPLECHERMRHPLKIWPNFGYYNKKGLEEFLLTAFSVKEALKEGSAWR